MFHKKINLPDTEQSCFDSYKSTGTGGNQGSRRTGLLEDSFVYILYLSRPFCTVNIKKGKLVLVLYIGDFLKINAISKIVA